MLVCSVAGLPLVELDLTGAEDLTSRAAADLLAARKVGRHYGQDIVSAGDDIQFCSLRSGEEIAFLCSGLTTARDKFAFLRALQRHFKVGLSPALSPLLSSALLCSPPPPLPPSPIPT